MKIFSERLREERISKGYSQEKFAELLGIGRNTYKNYELLGTPYGNQPPLDLIVKIADILNISLDYLFGREDYK